MFNRRILIGSVSPPVLPTVAFRVKATSNANTITIPASAQSGDIAVVVNHDRNGVFSTPAGWALVGQDTLSASDDWYSAIYVKVLSGGDPSTLITLGSGDRSKNIMLVFSGGASSATGNSFVTDMQEQAALSISDVTSVAGSAPLIVIGHLTVDNNMAALAGSDTFDAEEEGHNNRQLVGYKIFNSSPSNFTVATSETNGRGSALQGCFIQVA